ARRQRLDSGRKRRGPGHGLGGKRPGEIEMPRSAENDLRLVEQAAGDGGKPAAAVLADADHREPRRGHGVVSSGRPAARALTAAAARAEPPRRPRSVRKGTPKGFCASACFDSAAPTNPTGKPSTTAGFGKPSAIRSNRWNS